MNTDLSELAASFTRHLRALGRSPRTLDLHNRAIRQYAGHARTLTVEGSLKVTRSAVESWLTWLSANRAPATVSARYRSFRTFVRWAESEELIEPGALSGIPAPRVPSTPVPLLPHDHISALLKTCRGKGFLNVRDAAVVRVLADTGMRKGELLGMTLTDLDLDAEQTIISGKAGKVRLAYFGSKTTLALDRYLRTRARQRTAGTSRLWISSHGPLSATGLQMLLYRRSERAGIPRVHPHLFRHRFAHDWLSNGGQERDLMRLMGWSTAEMLAVYGASAADERAKNATKRMNLGDAY